MLRTKSIEQSIRDTEESEHKLRKDLSAWDLTVFGIGVIIGTGIFVLTGIAAATKAVAVGWAQYFASVFPIPESISGEGSVNLAAGAIVLVLTAVMILGVKLSSRFNAVMVAIKLAVVLLFIAAGVVATTAEETRRPQRDMPIGILTSLAICTVLYVVVSLVLTGIVKYTELNTAAPMADALKAVGYDWIANLVSLGALAGLTTVILILLMGQSRVLFAMSRDRLLPGWLSSVHPRFGTPWVISLITGVVVAAIATFVPLSTLADMVNIGTLFAFVLVSLGVIVLRRTQLPHGYRNSRLARGQDRRPARR